MPGERRAQHLLVEHRLLLLDLGTRILQIEIVGIHDRLADRLRLPLLHVAVVGDLRKVRGRLQRLQFRRIVLGAQPQQHRAGGDIVARAEIDLIDDAGDLQRQVGAVHRAQAAHRLHLRLPVLQTGGRGGDGLRRIGQRRHHLLDDVRLEVLECEESAEHDAHGDQHDDHALDHVSQSPSGPLRVVGDLRDIGAMPPAAAQRLKQCRRVGVAIGLGLHEADARLLPGPLRVQQREIVDGAELILPPCQIQARERRAFGGGLRDQRIGIRLQRPQRVGDVLARLMTVPRYCAAVCSNAATAARFLCSSVPASNSVCVMPPAMLHTGARRERIANFGTDLLEVMTRDCAYVHRGPPHRRPADRQGQLRAARFEEPAVDHRVDSCGNPWTKARLSRRARRFRRGAR